MPSWFVNTLWWAAYFVIAVGLQRYFPGIDAIVPGIILSCQEGRTRQTVLLCAFAILIQEGTGSLDFGAAFLWYAATLFLFIAGRVLFLTGSLFFIVLLSLALGALHAAILYTFSSLQNFPVPVYHLAQQGMGQAFLIPPLYALASLARKRYLNYEYGI